MIFFVSEKFVKYFTKMSYNHVNTYWFVTMIDSKLIKIILIARGKNHDELKNERSIRYDKTYGTILLYDLANLENLKLAINYQFELAEKRKLDNHIIMYVGYTLKSNKIITDSMRNDIILAEKSEDYFQISTYFHEIKLNYEEENHKQKIDNVLNDLIKEIYCNRIKSDNDFVIVDMYKTKTIENLDDNEKMKKISLCSVM